jgi:succinyl-CoA synthetase alpha subunit
MRGAGTRIVAGVAPGRAGSRVEGLEEVPVFGSVSEARKATDANASIAFVPPAAAAESLVEAMEAGLDLVVAITDGIPVHDMLRVRRRLEVLRANGYRGRLLGPNGPGVIAPGRAKVGIMPEGICRPGPVGIASRSGSLSYETVRGLSAIGIGQSAVVGVGGDPVKGTTFEDLLPLFEADPETRVIVLLGEVGGTDEERAAAWIARHGTNRSPRSSPAAGRRRGSRWPPGARPDGQGTRRKIETLRRAGVQLARDTDALATTVKDLSRGEGGSGTAATRCGEHGPLDRLAAASLASSQRIAWRARIRGRRGRARRGSPRDPRPPRPDHGLRAHVERSPSRAVGSTRAPRDADAAGSVRRPPAAPAMAPPRRRGQPAVQGASAVSR